MTTIPDPRRGYVRGFSLAAAAIFLLSMVAGQRAEALSLINPGTAGTVKQASDGLTVEVRGGHGGGGHFRGGGGGGFHGRAAVHGGGFRAAHVFRGGGYRGYRVAAFHRHHFHRRFFHRRFYAAPSYYYSPYRYCRIVMTYYGPRRICRYRAWHHHWRYHHRRHHRFHAYW